MDSGPSPRKGSRGLRSEGTYSSWRQVAGYFDGDGNVRLEVRRYVLRLGIRFVDTWKPQLEAVSEFLSNKGISVGTIGREGKGKNRPAYSLAVDESASVERVIRAMIPFCAKKKEDLRIALDYLQNRITGDEAIKRFNEQSAIGRRRWSVRESRQPYTRNQGQRLHELNNAKIARDAHFVKVDPQVQAQIRQDHLLLGISLRKLHTKYGYSEGVLRRILRDEARPNVP